MQGFRENTLSIDNQEKRGREDALYSILSSPFFLQLRITRRLQRQPRLR